MTKDEAIKIFEYYQRQHDRGLPVMVTKRDIVALDMAIEALKQPQIIRCKDCINQGMNDCPMWEGMITEDYMWCCEGEKK